MAFSRNVTSTGMYAAAGYCPKVIPIDAILPAKRKKRESIRLVPISDVHHRDLYAVHLRTDKFLSPNFEFFKKGMEVRTGFTIFAGEEVIGAITFTDYVPDTDIIIHCSVAPEHHGGWAIRRGLYHQVFNYCFDDLGLQRVTGISIPGVSDAAGRLLLALGFKHEGFFRNKIKLPDGKFYDLNLYGLLRDERRKWKVKNG